MTDADFSTRKTEMMAAGPAAVARAAGLLADGRLVAFPTETVYGLGADATNERAVADIFAAKGRPAFNPLIAHVSDAEMAAGYADISPLALEVIEAFWPGPLSVILPLKDGAGISLLATAGLDTIALRMPDADFAREMITRLGRPVVAPSANRSGSISPTTPAHVADGLGGRVDLIVAGGACAVGLESTVLDLSGARPALLRPGAITADDIAAVIGRPVLQTAGDDATAPRSPGQLLRHYAPQKPLRLDVDVAEADEILLGFGPSGLAGGQAAGVISLSDNGDLHEAAARLFAALREADAANAPRIAVMPVPDQGLGLAINDRLKRAAAGSGNPAQG